MLSLILNSGARQRASVSVSAQRSGKTEISLWAHLAARERGVNCILFTRQIEESMLRMQEIRPGTLFEVVAGKGLIAHPPRTSSV